jgi:pimeloyl-ACP methyl ester carboxylesterase
VPSASIVLQGQSLGTGVAAELALRGYASRVVLISPFTSMTDMARKLLPFLPVDWLVRDRYDTAAKAARIALPALVIHGTEDAVIPVHMGQRVADLLPNSRLVRIPGAGHNDLFANHRARMLSEITSFALEAR